MSGVLKRKFAEVDDEDPCYSSSPPSSLSSSEWESDVENSSDDSRDLMPSNPASPASLPTRSILKRPKMSGGQGSVRFDLVTVFLFPRCQGFSSVPSRGGATLGMVQRHSSVHRYTLAEHAQDRRRRHRETLRERRREERLQALKHRLIASGAIDQREADRLTVDQVPDGDLDVNVSDSELENGSFLHPYSSKQRQALLRAAGVKRIDKEEKRQLHALRLAREDCGCDCQGFCEPETCACNLAGIKCQMDRFNFPCGCSKDSCGNTQGRVEFNSRRVKTHHIHTIMRLELERTLQGDRLDQRGRAETLQDEEAEDRRLLPDNLAKSCPFGFSFEEDGLSLSLPPTPTFHFSSELSLVEENSCSSDMTDSSCSSAQSDDSDAERPNLLQVDNNNGGLSQALVLCDSESEDCSMGSDSELRHTRQPLTQNVSVAGTYSTDTTDTMETLCASRTDSTHTENNSRTSVANYLDENANQAVDLFDDNSLDEYPNTPSPSIDYSSSSYMDLSLSSDSDLEFFDSDYSYGPLHNSFKGHSHPDNFHHLHLQLSSSSSIPLYNESSTCLLESLIGLSEPSPEQTYPFTENHLLEQIQ